MKNDIQDFYSSQASQQAYTKERNGYPKRIKELNQKLAGYIKMRDELLDMIRIKDEKIANVMQSLSESENLLTKECDKTLELTERFAKALEVIRFCSGPCRIEGYEDRAREFLKKHEVKDEN